MQGDYAKAETAAENVINSGYFHLMEDRFGERQKQTAMCSPTYSLKTIKSHIRQYGKHLGHAV